MGGKKLAAILTCLAMMFGFATFAAVTGQAASGDVTVTADVPSPSGGSGGPPGATTEPATDITKTSATLHATVNPGGVEATYHFVWSGGSNPDTSTESLSAGFDSNNHEVSAVLDGVLQPGTEYTFRVVISNGFGATQGGLLPFTTDSQPAPTATTDDASGVTATTATLNGEVNANGNSGLSAHFEWGDSPSGQTFTNDQDPGTGTENVSIAEPLTGLLPNTTYYYRIVVTGFGDSIPGEQLQFTTGTSPPIVETDTAGDITSSSATLFGSVDTNGFDTSYHFEWGTDTLTETAGAGTLSAGNNSAVTASISGLAPNTRYFYRIVATSAGGASHGETLSFDTNTAPPDVTTGDATAITTDSATLNGTINPHGTAASYRFEYGLDTSYGQVTDFGETDSGFQAVAASIDISGLQPSTTYHFRLVANNDTGGDVAGEDGVFTTGSAAPSSPTAITGPADQLFPTSADLQATVTANGALTTVHFEYGTTTSYGTSTTPFDIGTGTQPTDIGVIVSSLQPGTTYHYRVVATNSVGTATGDDVTFTTPANPPDATTGTATSITSASATLNGSVTPNGGTTTYFFQYGLTTSYGSASGSTNAGSGSSAIAASADIAGLTASQTYHFRIVAVQNSTTVDGDDHTFTTPAASTVPSAVTDPATDIVQDAATLNATINAQGASTTYTFEYGLTDSYGSTTSTSAVVNGTTDSPVSLGIHGLSPSTTYHFRITATNVNGTAIGADRTFTTNEVPPPPATAPTAITNPATNVNPGSADLNGTVTANGAATAVHFEYGLTSTYGTSTTPIDIGSGTQPIDIGMLASALAPGTTYHFEVVATNSQGTALGADRTFTTPAASPSVTTQDASDITSASATLNGTVNPNGAATTYYFQYGTDASYGSTTSPAAVGSGTTEVDGFAAISGLLPGTTYHFSIVASNSAGTSIGSDKTFTTSGAAPTVETGLATDVTTTTATLNGTVTSNGADTHYYFEYGTTASYGNVTPGTDVGAAASGLPVDAAIDSLEPATTYHFRIVGYNDLGTTPGDDQIFTTDEPAALPPTAITGDATDVTDTSATLNGTVNPNGSPTTYQFVYGTTAEYGGTTDPVDAGTGTSGLAVAGGITGLAPETTYHFALTATSDAGTSFGEDQTFTTGSTPTPPAVGPAATTGPADGITDTAATLTGTVTPNGAPTTVHFEYGTDTSYGQVTPDVEVGAGMTELPAVAGLSGLDPQTLYHFRIIATNVNGMANGADETFTTLPSAPVVETDDATGITDVAATLNGLVNPNGADTTYHFQYGTTTEYGQATPDVTADSGGTGTTIDAIAPIDGLAPGTTYHFRIVGVSVGGTSHGEDHTFTTDEAPVETPAPSAVTQDASDITSDSATLNGAVNPNGAATSYHFQYGLTATYGNVTASTVIGAGAETLPATAAVAGLAPATTYHFRVVASSQFGTSVGEDLTFTTNEAPVVGQAPTVLTQAATDLTAAGATLNGSVNPNGQATTYHFEYGITAAYGNVTTPTDAGDGNAAIAATFTVAGLNAATTYHVRIVATNATGTSNGEDLTFTTTAAQVTPGGGGDNPPVDNPPVDNPPVVTPPIGTPPIVTPPVVTPPVVTPPVVKPPVVTPPVVTPPVVTPPVVNPPTVGPIQPPVTTPTFPPTTIVFTTGGAPAVGPTPTPTQPTTPTTTPTQPTTPTPPQVNIVANGLQLSQLSAPPGGAVGATGKGCPANSNVVLTIGKQQVGQTVADGDGRFSAPVQLPTSSVGRYLVVATCGASQLNAPLDLVLVSSQQSAPAAQVVTAVLILGFFILLLGLVLRRSMFSASA